MNADQRLLAMSFVISATAYLLGCVACGIAWHMRAPIVFALFALAANTASYMLQFNGRRDWAVAPSVGAWCLGVFAGAWLWWFL